MIIIFATQTCHFCKEIEDYLTKKGFKFVVHDVGENEFLRDKLIEKTGQMGVPVVEIDGQIVLGYNLKKINEILGINE